VHSRAFGVHAHQIGHPNQSGGLHACLDTVDVKAVSWLPKRSFENDKTDED